MDPYSLPTHLIGTRPAAGAPAADPTPASQPGPRPTGRMDRETGLPEVVLTPASPLDPDRSSDLALRVIGPGRRERAYRDRIDSLEAETRLLRGSRDRAHQELEVALRIERGTSRYVDKLEERCVEAHERADLALQQKNRVILALGAELRENERLREALASSRAKLARLEMAPPPAPRPLWARWIGGLRRR